MTATGKIFISYRREDSPADARNLRDRLAQAFGETNVFMDVDNLKPGRRFDQALEQALDQCDVFVPVIGLRWQEILEHRAQTGERDFVREEIATALSRSIPVIPVLVAPARLPPVNGLPSDISTMVLYQKSDLTHEHFGSDMARLIDAISSFRGPPDPPATADASALHMDLPFAPAQSPPTASGAWIGKVLGLIIVAVAAWFGFQYVQQNVRESEARMARQQQEWAEQNRKAGEAYMKQITFNGCRHGTSFNGQPAVACEFALHNTHWTSGLCLVAAGTAIFDQAGVQYQLSQIDTPVSQGRSGDQKVLFARIERGIRTNLTLVFQTAGTPASKLQALRISHGNLSLFRQRPNPQAAEEERMSCDLMQTPLEFRDVAVQPRRS